VIVGAADVLPQRRRGRGLTHGRGGLQTLYEILRGIARSMTRIRTRPADVRTLSHLYQEQTRDWLEPHGSWDWPLDTINKRLERWGCRRFGCDREPGHLGPGAGFWNTVARTRQAAPRNADERRLAHLAILEEVRAAAWPAALPAG
jgi:hypothetical protein